MLTPEQVVAVTVAVTRQCEATERTNAWHYNFEPATARRERSVRLLLALAGAAIDLPVEDMTTDQVIAFAQVVDAVVATYDLRNRTVSA